MNGFQNKAHVELARVFCYIFSLCGNNLYEHLIQFFFLSRSKIKKNPELYHI